MTTAAFKATYSDWKVVKGRKVVQVVFEMPLETADTAYQVLGGMPSPAAEVWCAVARLEVPAPLDLGASSSGEREPASDPGLPAERGHKSPAQIAGYLCTLGSFQEFLREKFRTEWVRNAMARGEGRTREEIAKECVYDICAVTSRRELTDKNTEWHALQLAFRLWQNHPELEDA